MYKFINKPKDWTSHDVVAYIRNRIRKSGLSENPNIKKIKVGHAGTLDPFATGLLIVGIGREATKRLDEFKTMPKTYIATIKLGATSDTQDSTGKITTHDPHNTTLSSSPPIRGSRHEVTRGSDSPPSLKRIKTVLQNFVGKQEQIPPMYSAKKVGGKKLYDLARQGIEIERQPNEIEIYDIKLLQYTPSPLQGEGWGEVTIEVDCSVGTYVRTLAHDIGQKLGCGAYCDELRRIKIGEYDVEQAVSPEDVDFHNTLST